LLQQAEDCPLVTAEAIDLRVDAGQAPLENLRGVCVRTVHDQPDVR
jgi:hypothetical protein